MLAQRSVVLHGWLTMGFCLLVLLLAAGMVPSSCRLTARCVRCHERRWWSWLWTRRTVLHSRWEKGPEHVFERVP